MNGDYIEDWSADGHKRKLFKPTRGLLKICEKLNSIRVFRASAFFLTNKYRSGKNNKYDGLYLIIDYNFADSGIVICMDFESRRIKNDCQFRG